MYAVFQDTQFALCMFRQMLETTKLNKEQHTWCLRFSIDCLFGGPGRPHKNGSKRLQVHKTKLEPK